MGLTSRDDRAALIEQAIARFESGRTTGDHDGRAIDLHLGIEAGFGGSPESQRQQIQQYFKEFPYIRHRWRGLVASRSSVTQTSPAAKERNELADAKREIARLGRQVQAKDQVADLLRRSAKRSERRIATLEGTVADLRRRLRERDDADTASVVPFPRPMPDQADDY